MMGHPILDRLLGLSGHHARRHNYVRTREDVVDLIGRVGIWCIMQTTGCLALAARSVHPGTFKMPSVANFSASCARKASVGATTSNFGQRHETRIDSITSVLPVPVGMTIVAVASVTDQCA